MKKYLLLFILTFLLVGVCANITEIEKSMAYTSSEICVVQDDIEEIVVCTGVLYKSPQNAFFAKIFINENLVADVKPKQNTKIFVNALEDVEFAGTMLSLAEEATVVKIGSLSQTMVEGLVQLEPSEYDYLLRSGYTVSVNIVTKTVKDVMLLPFTSVGMENNEKYVYKITENWAVKTKIEVIKETEKGAVVQSASLKIGDRVLLELDGIPQDKKHIRIEN